MVYFHVIFHCARYIPSHFILPFQAILSLLYKALGREADLVRINHSEESICIQNGLAVTILLGLKKLFELLYNC